MAYNYKSGTILNFMLRMKELEQRQELSAKELKRQEDRDRALGSHQASQLRLQEAELASLTAYRQAMVRDNQERTEAYMEKSDRANKMSIANLMMAKLQMDRKDVKPGKTESMESYMNARNLDGLVKSLSGMPPEDIMQSQAGMMPFTRPDEEEEKKMRTEMFAWQYGLPMLARFGDTDAFQAYMKELLSGKIPAMPTLEKEEADKMSLLDLSSIAAKLGQIYSPESVSDFMGDYLEEKEPTDVSLLKPKEKAPFTMLEVQRLVEQEQITTLEAQKQLKDIMNKRRPGANYQWIDVNPGYGEDIRIISKMEAEEFIKNPNRYGYRGKLDEASIKKIRALYEKTVEEVESKRPVRDNVLEAYRRYKVR